MLVLDVGKYNITEIIEWFGIRYDTFYGNKKKYLDKLRKYCRYKILNNNEISISKVYSPLYKSPTDNRRMVTAARYFEKFWNKSRIDTIEDMMRKLLEANVNF